MESADADTLARFTRWFAAQCDGSWEHDEGITIESLDNPGWRVRIHLLDTPLEAIPFAEKKDAFEHKDNWMRCWRTESSFEIACGVPRLGDALVEFLNWADQHAAPKQSS